MGKRKYRKNYYIVIQTAKQKEDIKDPTAYKVYKDATSITKDFNIPVQTIRNNISIKGYYKRGDILIIVPSSVQKDSNAGGQTGSKFGKIK